MMEYGAITDCQLCGHKDLESVVFLGYLPPVNMMRPIGRAFAEETWFPAEMLYCPKCHLVQLGYAVDPQILFPPEYPYTSGTTKILRDNFAQLYQEVMKLIGLEKDDLIVDVGSNDGTLLSNFKNHRVAGIEPSLTAKLAEERGIPTVMEYFNAESVKKVKDRFGTPKIVTATNVFAHIHKIGELMTNITELTGPDGIFISESHYLGDLVETLQYDTIYHEHLRYYSLISIQNLLKKYGFNVFHVQRIPTHGGSIRVYASRGSRFAPDASVGELLAVERKQGLEGTTWISSFRERIVRSKLALYETLAELKKKGARIHGIGAPSRASTLINYVGLDDGVLDCVLEVKNSLKVGKYMPGRKIPVQDEARLYSEQPEYALLLSWHIAEELSANLIRNGYKGDFIVPLPEPHIIRNSGRKWND
jgi:hypothetical protein